MNVQNSPSFLDPIEQYHQDAFDRISDEKKERIYKAATSEFAEKGFSRANVNNIAKNAEISIGAMYKYFRSKEDLFLSIIDNAYKMMLEIFRNIDLGQGNIFEKFEIILRAAHRFAKEYPELNKIYLFMATGDTAHLSLRLSQKVESITAHYYMAIIDKAKAQGIVDPETDKQVAAFCMDNLVLLFQYSQTSAYFAERMKIYIGANAENEEERIIKGIARFFCRALKA